MKTTNKGRWNITYLLVSVLFLLLFLFSMNPNGQAIALSNNQRWVDSTRNQSTVREVLTGQKLFVVEGIDNKTKPNVKTVKFKAELRDAYTIISYDQGSSSVELDWTMCPKNYCPKPGSYNYGTAEYKKLDTLIETAIKNAAKRKS